MDRKSIFNYVKLYKHILDRQQILLDEQDLSNIYHLILLVFKLDDLYDRIEQYPPSPDKLADIKTAMISLMPNYRSIGHRAIAQVFQAMKDEALFIANPFLDLNQYLKVSSRSIGAPIITAYLASKIKLDSSIWYSDILVSFNSEINALIRLANDLLDTDVEQPRIFKETAQIKARVFFASKSQLKSYLLYKYVIHKLHYYFYLIKYKYWQLSPNAQEYSRAIACSESVLNWAFQVYVRDRNSCQ